MRRCDSDRCWCSWPPVRLIMSTGERYTMDELPAEEGRRVFRYLYL